MDHNLSPHDPENDPQPHPAGRHDPVRDAADAWDETFEGDPCWSNPVAVDSPTRVLPGADHPATLDGVDDSLLWRIMPSVSVGTTVADRYQILKEIGSGGMGVVYLAEQVAPVRRTVAIKLIRDGMYAPSALARFESERQALAIMDHPNIARVLEAGTTGEGRPFFVMELVRGVPLTDFCAAHNLNLIQRLGLFRQVCEAIQHAHQKGIIHRDLKPNNILVEVQDGKPVPKVIDFGLVKTTGGVQLTDRSLKTAFGTIAGTPSYMAPEQATFAAVDVDTRADIYSLGVILYELLTGTTPLGPKLLRCEAMDDVLRMIREEEPQVPSQKLVDSPADHPPTPPSELMRLSRSIRGDLDWVVMKALAKERGRRYNSAIELACDIERFLNDEPVSAGPPTARYRAGKFFRRYRRQVIAASLLLVSLVGGVIGTTIGLLEARSHARFARRQVRERDAALRAEADERRQGERRLAQMGRANEILGSIFRDLNPERAAEEGKPLNAVLGERLDRATEAMDADAIGDPLMVARMQMTLAESQAALGYHRKAAALIERAHATFADRLGPRHRDTLEAGNSLAAAHAEAGDPDRALPLLEQTHEAQRATLGPDHPDTLSTAHNLAAVLRMLGKDDRVIPLLESILAARRAKLGPDDPETLNTMNSLADALSGTDQFDRAIALMEQVAAAHRATLGPDHPKTLISGNNLADMLQVAGRFDRAIPLFEQTLAAQRVKLGPDHPNTLNTANNLAAAFRNAGRPAEAIPLHEQVLKTQRVRLGSDHPKTLISLNNLALAYVATGQPERAIPLHEETVAGRRARLGPDDPATLLGLGNLAYTYRSAGQPRRAIPVLEQLLESRRAKLGPEHAETLDALASLASACEEAGDLDRSGKLGREALATLRRVAPGSTDVADIEHVLGRVLVRQKRYAEAEPILRDCLAITEANHLDTWPAWQRRSLLGAALLRQGKRDEAAPLLVAGYEGMRRLANPITPTRRARLDQSLDWLIEMAEATGDAAALDRWKQERAARTSLGRVE